MEEKTLKQLQAELVELGMAEEAVKEFKTKAQCLAVIESLKAKVPEEVKKVASIEEKPNPVEERQTNKNWVTKAKIMRDKLLAQPKVGYMIPLEQNEKTGVVEWRTNKNGEPYQVHIAGNIWTVQLNGFKWMIPKGVVTHIPQQIAEELSQSMKITMEAGRDFSLDRINPDTGKSVSEELS